MVLAKFNPCQPCCFVSNCCVLPNKVPNDVLCLKFYEIVWTDETQVYLAEGEEPPLKILVGSVNITKIPGTNTWSNLGSPVKFLTNGAIQWDNYVFYLTCYYNRFPPTSNALDYQGNTKRYTLRIEENCETWQNDSCALTSELEQAHDDVVPPYSNAVVSKYFISNFVQCDPHFLAKFYLKQGFCGVYEVQVEDLNGIACDETDAYNFLVDECEAEGWGSITPYTLDAPAPLIAVFSPAMNCGNGASTHSMGGIFAHNLLFYNGNCEYVGPHSTQTLFTSSSPYIYVNSLGHTTKLYLNGDYIIYEVFGAWYFYRASSCGWESLTYNVKYRMLKEDWDVYGDNKLYFYEASSSPAGATFYGGVFPLILLDDTFFVTIRASARNIPLLNGGLTGAIPVSAPLYYPEDSLLLTCNYFHYPRPIIPKTLYATIEADCPDIDGQVMTLHLQGPPAGISPVSYHGHLIVNTYTVLVLNFVIGYKPDSLEFTVISVVSAMVDYSLAFPPISLPYGFQHSSGNSFPVTAYTYTPITDNPFVADLNITSYGNNFFQCPTSGYTQNTIFHISE